MPSVESSLGRPPKMRGCIVDATAQKNTEIKLSLDKAKSIIMENEFILNRYYNTGRFNSSLKIGFMMDMIRTLKPLSKEEWMLWYLNNVHDEQYLFKLAEEMSEIIPSSYQITASNCFEYICDVMFRRTFEGYNNEKRALLYLRKTLSLNVKEAPKEWDVKYFIDFYVIGKNSKLLGIQLKPVTFYSGKYYEQVDIRGKILSFCHQYNAMACILIYSHSASSGHFSIENTDMIEFVKKKLA